MVTIRLRIERNITPFLLTKILIRNTPVKTNKISSVINHYVEMHQRLLKSFEFIATPVKSKSRL
jgi:hypothetical protein